MYHLDIFSELTTLQGAKTGKDNGYTMLFDIESFDYSYYDEGSEGLKLALVHHLDMPIMRQKGFHIAPGTVTSNASIRCTALGGDRDKDPSPVKGRGITQTLRIIIL